MVIVDSSLLVVFLSATEVRASFSHQCSQSSSTPVIAIATHANTCPRSTYVHSFMYFGTLLVCCTLYQLQSHVLSYSSNPHNTLFDLLALLV